MRQVSPQIAVGATLLLGALPVLAALLLGRLHRGGDPYPLLSLAGIPSGIAFLILGSRSVARKRGGNPEEGTTGDDPARVPVRLALFALIQGVFAAGFGLAVHAGIESLGTAYRFLAVFASFLSLLAGGLALRAAAQGRGDGPGTGAGTGTDSTTQAADRGSGEDRP